MNVTMTIIMLIIMFMILMMMLRHVLPALRRVQRAVLFSQASSRSRATQVKVGMLLLRTEANMGYRKFEFGILPFGITTFMIAIGREELTKQ